MRPEGATHLLVIGHGASTNMRHAALAAISESLAEQALRRSGITSRIRKKAAGEIRQKLVLRRSDRR